MEGAHLKTKLGLGAALLLAGCGSRTGILAGEADAGATGDNVAPPLHLQFCEYHHDGIQTFMHDCFDSPPEVCVALTVAESQPWALPPDGPCFEVSDYGGPMFTCGDGYCSTTCECKTFSEAYCECELQ